MNFSGEKHVNFLAKVPNAATVNQSFISVGSNKEIFQSFYCSLLKGPVLNYLKLTKDSVF